MAMYFIRENRILFNMFSMFLLIFAFIGNLVGWYDDGVLSLLVTAGLALGLVGVVGLLSENMLTYGSFREALSKTHKSYAERVLLTYLVLLAFDGSLAHWNRLILFTLYGLSLITLSIEVTLHRTK
jgi:hypothetical protein